MRLAVSNIAWNNNNLPSFLRFLKNEGCHGVELAINKIWSEPVDASKDCIQKLRQLLRENEIELVGFHALFFTRPDLQFFANGPRGREAFFNYLKNLAWICSQLGGKILVWGSPRNRQLSETFENSDSDDVIPSLRRFMETISPSKVTIALEHLSPKNTSFVASYRECVGLVQEVNHPQFRPHLDIGTVVECGEAISHLMQFSSLPVHVHVNEPGLTPPTETGPVNHPDIGAELRKYQYDGYVSLEARSDSIGGPKELAQIIKFMRESYLGNS